MGYSTQQVATFFRQPLWKIQRLFELRIVRDVPRFAGKRVIPREMLPEIAEALEARGWLREPAEEMQV